MTGANCHCVRSEAHGMYRDIPREHERQSAIENKLDLLAAVIHVHVRYESSFDEHIESAAFWPLHLCDAIGTIWELDYICH